MKRFLYSIVMAIAVISISSCQSKEDKALKLINAEMFKTLYDYKSYEPIETKIDSAFTDPIMDTNVVKYSIAIMVAKERFEDAMRKFNNELDNMNIWLGSYSSYGRSRFDEANKKADGYLEEAKGYNALVESSKEKIKEILDNTGHEFIGWKVTHKFRCNSKGGQPSIGTYLYYIDSKFKEVLYSDDINDKNYIAIRDIIKEVAESDPVVKNGEESNNVES